MAGEVFKAGIRFNHPQFKYMSLLFNEASNSCIVDATVVLPETGKITLRGEIVTWSPVTQDTAASNMRTTKTTAKKTIKENK